VTNPSAVIGKDYELHIFTLKDGRVVSGMVRAEDDQLVTVQSPRGERVRKAEIRSEDKRRSDDDAGGAFRRIVQGANAGSGGLFGSSQQVSLAASGPKDGRSLPRRGSLRGGDVQDIAGAQDWLLFRRWAGLRMEFFGKFADFLEACESRRCLEVGGSDQGCRQVPGKSGVLSGA
jgi:hypothetical protein